MTASKLHLIKGTGPLLLAKIINGRQFTNNMLIKVSTTEITIIMIIYWSKLFLGTVIL
jgi:hypothetical protein